MFNVFVYFDILRVIASVGLFCRCDCCGWVAILFVMLRLYRLVTTYVGRAFYMAAADDVYSGDLFCNVFFHRVSWVGSRI